MTFKQEPLRLEITVDGNGWDKPVSVKGNKRPKQPHPFSIEFSNKDGKNTSRIALPNVVRVYAGLGALEEEPTFTGFLSGKSNRNPINLQFTSMSGIEDKDEQKVSDFGNLDGLECGYAIQKVLESYDFSGYSSALQFQIKGTNPINVIPKSFRVEDYDSKLSLIKAINDRFCIDESVLPDTPLGYTFYEVDNVFYHRKIPPIDGTVEPAYRFGTIDNISTQPSIVLSNLVTKATVFGGNFIDGVGRERRIEATHEDLSAIQLKRLSWPKPTSDSSITTYFGALNKARQLVETNKFKIVRTSIQSVNLLNAVPDYSIVEVERSDFDLDGIHLIEDIDISLGRGRNSVVATVNSQKPLPRDVLAA